MIWKELFCECRWRTKPWLFLNDKESPDWYAVFGYESFGVGTWFHPLEVTEPDASFWDTAIGESSDWKGYGGRGGYGFEVEVDGRVAGRPATRIRGGKLSPYPQRWKADPMEDYSIRREGAKAWLGVRGGYLMTFWAQRFHQSPVVWQATVCSLVKPDDWESVGGVPWWWTGPGTFGKTLWERLDG